MDSSSKEGDTQAMMEELEALETDTRRMEMKRKGDEQGRKSQRRKLDKLEGWGEPVVAGSSQHGDLEAWKLKTATARVMPEVAAESRLEENTRNMLAMNKNVSEVRKAKKKEMS